MTDYEKNILRRTIATLQKLLDRPEKVEAKMTVEEGLRLEEWIKAELDIKSCLKNKIRAAKFVMARRLYIYLARELFNEQSSALAVRLGMDTSNVNLQLRAARHLMCDSIFATHYAHVKHNFLCTRNDRSAGLYNTSRPLGS